MCDRPLSFVRLPLPPSKDYHASAGPSGKEEAKAQAEWFEQVQERFLVLQRQYNNLELDVKELEVVGSLWIKLTDRLDKLEACQKLTTSAQPSSNGDNISITALETKVRALEDRLEQQQEHQRSGEAVGSMETTAVVARLERQVQEIEAALLKQQQHQEHKEAATALQLATIELQAKKLEALGAQLGNVSPCHTTVPHPMSPTTPTGNMQLALLKKQVAEMEDMLAQHQQQQHLSNQEVKAELSTFQRHLKDVELGHVQQQQQYKRCIEQLGIMEKQLKEVSDQQPLCSSSLAGYNRQVAALEKQIKDVKSEQQQALIQYSSTAVDNDSKLTMIERQLEGLTAAGLLRSRNNITTRSSVATEEIEQQLANTASAGGAVSSPYSFSGPMQLAWKDLTETVKQVQALQNVLSKQQEELGSKCSPQMMDIMQDALSEAVARLADLERDKDVLKSTYVRASALKELENYLLERLSIQSDSVNKLAKLVDTLVADANNLAGVHNLDLVAGSSGRSQGGGSNNPQPLTLTAVLRNYITFEFLAEKFAQISMVEKVAEKTRANDEIIIIAMKELDSKYQTLVREVYNKGRNNDELILMAMKDMDTKFKQNSDTQANAMLRIAQQIDYIQNQMREAPLARLEVALPGGPSRPPHLMRSNSMARGIQQSSVMKTLLAERESMHVEENMVDRAIRTARSIDPPAQESGLSESLISRITGPIGPSHLDKTVVAESLKRWQADGANADCHHSRRESSASGSLQLDRNRASLSRSPRRKRGSRTGLESPKWIGKENSEGTVSSKASAAGRGFDADAVTAHTLATCSGAEQSPSGGSSMKHAASMHAKDDESGPSRCLPSHSPSASQALFSPSSTKFLLSRDTSIELRSSHTKLTNSAEHASE